VQVLTETAWKLILAYPPTLQRTARLPNLRYATSS